MATFNNDAMLAAAAQMLQASGPSRQQQGLGSILGGGMSTYLGAAEQARQRKMEEDQARQVAELRAMQVQELQGTLGDKATARARAERLTGLQQQFARGSVPAQTGTGAQGQAPAAQMGGGQFYRAAEQAGLPTDNATLNRIVDGVNQGQTPEQAAAGIGSAKPNQQSKPKSPYQTAMEYAQFLNQNGEVQQAMSVAEEAQKLRPKVKSFEKVRANGQVLFAPLFEDGTAGDPIPMEAAEKLMQVDRGGSTDMVDSYTGQVRTSLKNSVSPNAQLSASVSMRGQNMTDNRAREFNGIAQEGKLAKLEEKREMANMTKNSQVASFDTMLGTLDRLGKHPGLPNSVGINSKFPTMPGSDSANFQAELDTFQSQAFIPMVAQLKGMGALSDAEGRKLTAAVGALNPNMGESAFRDSLKRITNDMEGARQRVSGQTRAAPSAIPSGAINMLKLNPKLRDAFEAKYGSGAAASVLGK